MKTIKGIYTILLFGLICFLNLKAQAQPNLEEQRKRILDFKIGIIKERLHFTNATQEQNFFTYYIQYENAKIENKKIMAQIRKEKFNFTASDAELLAAMELLMSYQQKDLDIEKEYQKKFLEVISVRQLVELYRTEQEIRKQLLQKLSENE
ncbi:MAG: hypothetical protein EAZ55_05250 [Cytophagales bacterium]|nr:MAG: hypothetical protein EAZ55_05250 [Cytophagales bacterium]